MKQQQIVRRRRASAPQCDAAPLVTSPSAETLPAEELLRRIAELLKDA